MTSTVIEPTIEIDLDKRRIVTRWLLDEIDNVKLFAELSVYATNWSDQPTEYNSTLHLARLINENGYSVWRHVIGLSSSDHFAKTIRVLPSERKRYSRKALQEYASDARKVIDTVNGVDEIVTAIFATRLDALKPTSDF